MLEQAIALLTEKVNALIDTFNAKKAEIEAAVTAALNALNTSSVAILEDDFKISVDPINGDDETGVVSITLATALASPFQTLAAALDSTLSGRKYLITLEPGNYQLTDAMTIKHSCDVTISGVSGDRSQVTIERPSVLTKTSRFYINDDASLTFGALILLTHEGFGAGVFDSFIVSAGRSANLVLGDWDSSTAIDLIVRGDTAQAPIGSGSGDVSVYAKFVDFKNEVTGAPRTPLVTANGTRGKILYGVSSASYAGAWEIPPTKTIPVMSSLDGLTVQNGLQDIN